MNAEWQLFLESRGARLVDGEAVFESGPRGDCNLWDLSHLGLIRVTGEDAETFLQGQLTNDVRQVKADRSQLSSFCNPKGRMLATFRLFRLGDSICLQLPRERLAPVLQRLRMFVLRAKVTVDDASDELIQVGLAGECALGILGDLAAPDVDGVIQRDGLCAVRLPGKCPRFLLAGRSDTVRGWWEHASHRARPANAASWRLLDIRAGIPTVYDQTVEAFVPQMLNMQLVNGVSFTKGCYTGQEVVARMQYLGKLKRRMYLVRTDTEACPEPGTVLFSPASESAQGTGRVVASAPSPVGGCEALVVVEIDIAGSADLRLGDANGPALTFLDLPYPFEESASATGR